MKGCKYEIKSCYKRLMFIQVSHVIFLLQFITVTNRLTFVITTWVFFVVKYSKYMNWDKGKISEAFLDQNVWICTSVIKVTENCIYN